MQAIKKALDQGVAMDPGYLEEGALARAKAISEVDGKGVLPLDDLVAIDSALDRVIKSSGEAATMGTVNPCGGVVAESMSFHLLSTVGPSDAKEEDVVEAR